MAGRHRAARGAAECLLQALRTGDGSRLAVVDGRAAAAISGRGGGIVRAGARHDWIRLAGVHRRGHIPGGDRSGARRGRGVLGHRKAADTLRDGAERVFGAEDVSGGRRDMKKTVAIVLLMAAAACGGNTGGATGTASTGQYTIAVIPKGTSHVYWQSIRAGAERAGKELGVNIIWRGPIREDDRDSQVSEVEGFVSRGVSGIVLAPLDESALAVPVASAVQRGIPVVIIDSGLKGEGYVSFVATDNRKSGRLAGEQLAKLLGGKGKVVLLRYTEGSDSTNNREEGFLEAMKESPGIQVLSSNQYGGADVEGAYKKSEALLSNYKQPDG